MCADKPSSPDSRDDSDPAFILRELFDCTELNLDDLEEHTRVVIMKARAVLELLAFP